MSKIRGGRGRKRMGNDAYSSYINNGGIYDTGATSCYGECHPNEAPCDPGCMCTGGGSGNDWWGTCTSEKNVGGSVRSQGGNGKWNNNGGSIMRKRRHRRRRSQYPPRETGW